MKKKWMVNFAFWIAASAVAVPAQPFSSEPIFNPIPKLTKLPANVSAAWLLHVYEAPQKYDMDEWVPMQVNISDSDLMAYSVNFISTYPIDKKRLQSSNPALKVNWISPRVRQSLSLDLWKEEPSDELKIESPWILPGRLTWTLVNFVYECTVPGRIYRIDLTRVDARTQHQLERRIDNEMLTMDYTHSWESVCNDKSL